MALSAQSNIFGGLNKVTYKPTHIFPWFETINYTGTLFTDFYVASWRFFRCSPMERSNHDFVKENLLDSGAAPGHVLTPTFTDEVMGFRYYVLVHRDADKALRMADMYAKRILFKGSLDPENELRVDRKTIHCTWAQCGVPARMSICKEAGISIFASRSNEFPQRYATELYAALSEVSHGE